MSGDWMDDPTDAEINELLSLTTDSLPIAAHALLPCAPRDDDGIEILPLWDPQVIDARLDELTNRRWRHRWQRLGDEGWQRPLIEEVDATGLDRTRIAYLISPEHLKRLEREAFRQRAQLTTQHQRDATVRVLSFQHLLIQAAQTAALEAMTVPLPQPYVTEPQRRWHVGDVVGFGQESFVVAQVTDRVVSLQSDRYGDFDVRFGTPEMSRLRLLSGGLRSANQ